MTSSLLPFDPAVMNELRIPGFSRQEAVCGHGLVPPPNDLAHQSTDAWYDRFRRRVLDAAAKRQWFPVYRLSDGEFNCMVGRQFLPLPLSAAILARLRHAYNTTRRLSPFYSAGRPGYCESYYFWELPSVRASLVKALKEIAEHGALCFNFSRSDLADPYTALVCQWLVANGIRIPVESYFHFYHVYALLNGPDATSLLAGRRVVVMTSNINDRKNALLRAAMDRGAASASFYETSRNRPALERIDQRRIPADVEIALLGAGVGAAQIITQLAPLRCIAIDAGFALDCWAEPALRLKRPYSVSDDLWDALHGDEKPAWCPK
jgi:hypothetical protein